MSHKKEKIREFSRMAPKELQGILKEKKERLRQLRFDLVAGKIKNVKETRAIRKDIARIETLLNMKRKT